MQALITNKNNPKVTIVAGNVKNISSGLTVMRKIPKTIATKIALVKFCICTPGNKFAIKTTATAVSNILNIVFIK